MNDQCANLVSPKGEAMVNYEIKVALDCKYMGGWDWNVYHKQPSFFLEAINALRKAEAREAKFQMNKKNGGDN